MSAQIISSKWEGHKAPVSCLDYSGDFLLSGSEDRTARLWDVRDTKRRAAWCVSAPGEVFSVKFAPKLSTEAMEMECSNPFAIDHIMYVRTMCDQSGMKGRNIKCFETK